MTTQELPIAAFRDQILQTVATNPVTIITAETGAGKSTQVPQYLLEAGYKVIVTEPRRLATRTLAARVAEETDTALGGLIGYRTAIDRADSAETRCLFCTDGLALVLELVGANQGVVLVLDEVHEWNENIEVLVAWTRRHLDSEIKVVPMSATLEAESLASFYGGAPTISVPGRLFPIEEKAATGDAVKEIMSLVQAGRNVLVFEPGKQEIGDTIEALREIGLAAEILPLHGDLTPAEQARCFKQYSRPKVVVATNVAQSSVTIDDIDAVVDTGEERRIELVDGVEGLYLKPISLADAAQRKGRAGRTKPGIYIDLCGAVERPEYPRAEILRKRLDQTVLRLAIAGFDMEELAFFRQPPLSEIRDAKRALLSLGCLTTEGQVTKIGRIINHLPVSVQYGRMLVEADRLGVIDDVLTVAAIMETNGITVPPPSLSKPDRPDWRNMVRDEHESDVMGQLAVWQMAESMRQKEMHEKGVSLKALYRAREIRFNLAKAVRQLFRFGTTGKRTDILKAVCAGMVDHLFVQRNFVGYVNGDGAVRTLGSSTLVSNANFIVGKPFDLEITTRWGSKTLNLVVMASKIDPAWLTEVAPQLVKKETGTNPHYDSAEDVIVSTYRICFRETTILAKEQPDASHPQAAQIFAEWLAWQPSIASPETDEMRALDAVLRANIARQNQARLRDGLNPYGANKAFSLDEITSYYQLALSGATRLCEVKDPQALLLPPVKEERVTLVYSDNRRPQVVASAKPTRTVAKNEKPGKPIDPSTVDLSKLFGGNARLRRP